MRELAKAAKIILALSLIPLPDAMAQSLAQSAPWVGETLWGTKCQGVPQAAQYMDYRRRHEYGKTSQVEHAHFYPGVEFLSVPQREYLHNIDFTLNWFPNHHRALNSAIRARLIENNNFKLLQWPPAECYLQRAVNFAPDDATVYMLYGILLQKMAMPKEALAQYRKAEAIEPANLQIKYNLGLLLFDLEEYEEAQKYAKQVYQQKFPLDGLRRKLSDKGYLITDAKSDQQVNIR